MKTFRSFNGAHKKKPPSSKVFLPAVHGLFVIAIEDSQMNLPSYPNGSNQVQLGPTETNQVQQGPTVSNNDQLGQIQFKWLQPGQIESNCLKQVKDGKSRSYVVI